MAMDLLVAVSYPVDDEFVQINTSVLDSLARLAFVHGRPEGEVREVLRQADALLAWHLGEELPAGALSESARLRFVQLLSAGADSVNYAAVPDRLMLASNVGAYAQPMAEYVMAGTLAPGPRPPPPPAPAPAAAPRRDGQGRIRHVEARAHAERRGVRYPGFRRHRQGHRPPDAGVRGSPLRGEHLGPHRRTGRIHRHACRPGPGADGGGRARPTPAPPPAHPRPPRPP